MSIFRKQDRLNWSLGTSIYYSGSSAADVERKIAAGGDVNGTFKDDYNRYSMIYWAARRSRADLVNLLLSKGADPNADEDHPETALLAAVGNKNSEIVRALLDAGARVDFCARGGEPPFIIAARQGAGDIVKLLVEKGADINAPTRDGNTALHLAAAQGFANLVTYLIEKGANVNATNGNLNTAADVAEREYPGLAALIRGKSAPEDPKVAEANSEWRLLAPDEIARVAVKEPIGYRITEIFNFTARTYTHIACNLDSRAESQSVKAFSELETPEPLDKAYGELVRLGGRAERGDAGKKRLQAPAT